MRNEANTLKQRVDELEQELQDCKVCIVRVFIN